MSTPDSPANFHVLRQRLRLTGEITTITALRIGSGGAGELDGADLPVLRDRAGFPFIPGGSLKGVLRSTVESLLRGALPDKSHALWPCDPHLEVDRSSDRDGACGWHPTNKRREAQANIDAHCPVCRLFGSRLLASHVRITDVLLHPEQRRDDARPIEVRDGVGIERDRRVVHPRGLKYDFEVVRPGTRFAVELFVDNPEDWLMGLLVLAFDQLADGFTALGGFSSRGLGRVDWRWGELYRVDARTLLAGGAGVVETALSSTFTHYRQALTVQLEEAH